jgi:hypothetical protein
VAHFTAIQKFLADAATTPVLTSLVEQSAAPLAVIEAGQYAIDSTGFSTAVYDVETAFAMIKAKFGATVASRLPVAQVNEVLAKCVAHNLCCVVKAIFTAGLAPTFWPDAAAGSAS